MAGTVKVRVRDGWAVYDGKQQVGGGTVVTLDQQLADQLLVSGAVEPAKEARQTKK